MGKKFRRKPHWPSYARSLKREAKKLAEAGEKKDFDRLIERALGIGDAYYRAQALAWIARRRHEAGYDSSQLFIRAVKTAEKVPQEWRRAEILVDIAYEMSKAGVKDFDPLLKAVGDIESEEHRFEALRAVRRRMAKLGLDTSGISLKARVSRERAERAPRKEKKLPPDISSIENKRKRITLGLFNTYTGKSLGVAHIRAIARAAPLCFAFNLNLCLFGFPVETPEEAAERVESETQVGEGNGYTMKLFREGRLFVLDFPDEPVLPNLGELVATTPSPSPKKRIAIERITKGSSPFCLLMGLGAEGLPKSVLRLAKYHLELTGKNIPLETCTAMGVLAAKLGSG